jgi:hypothetical protein
MENLNPYNIFNFIGNITLDPSSDTWKNTEVLPAVLVTDNTLYTAMLTQLQQQNKLGTVWNEWVTDWVGQPTTSTQEKAFNLADWTNVAANELRFWQTGEVATGTATIPVTTTTSQSIGQKRAGQVTTIQNIPQEIVDNKIVNVAMVPFIRQKTVSFVATGLKPLTRFYAFFDNSDVTTFCSPNPLITDANGKVSGTFTIPDPTVANALKFRTGTRVFKLCNDSANQPGAITSFATANYVASGSLEQTQRTITTVGVPVVQEQTVTDTRTINSVTTTQTTKTVNWVDPLAQSFLVGTLDGGYCATSLDLFFSRKDTSLPVTVQIREMQNGSPTQSVVPFSTVVLNPSQINVSSDASVASRFSFQSPVYLKQGVEYAIVVISNSDNYFVWTALVGDALLNTDRYISQVPYAGVMFKSQNASTWTASQGQALKFTLYRALFNTAVLGAAVFQNPDLDLEILPDLSIITYNGTNAIRIRDQNHGMPSGSKVTVSIPPGTSNANWGASYNGILVSKIVPTQNSDLRDASQPSGVADTVLGSRTYTVSNVELDSYTISITDAANAAVNATSSGYTGVSFSVTRNMAYDVMMPIVHELNFPGTSTNYYTRAITGKSTHGSQTPYQRDVSGGFPYTQFIPNKNFTYAAPRLVASLINETKLINIGTAFQNKSLVWLVNLTSTLNNLSPMIDVSRMGAVLVSNRIDYRTNSTTPATSPSSAAPVYAAETVAKGATASQARYITRPAVLQSPANSIHVLLNTMLPYGAQVDVYYRVLPTNTNTTFDTQPYVLMSPDSTTDFSPAQSVDDFKDFYWRADNIGEFTKFSIKIVMRSTNSSAVPLCKELRVISLDTFSIKIVMRSTNSSAVPFDCARNYA